MLNQGQLFKPACCVTVALMWVGQEMPLHKHLVCACGSSFGRQLAYNACRYVTVKNGYDERTYETQ